MDYLIKINQRIDEFTPSDKKIADFIINNPKQTVGSNTSELATMTETSQSAIIRFVKKIGYKGYIDLKLDIAGSLEADSELLKDEVIAGGDYIESIISKSKNNVSSAVEKTFALIDKEIIKRAVDEIDKANSVYLAGVGSSGLICEDFLYKLQRAGKKAYYQRDAHTNLSLITNISNEDILVSISYSGNTEEVIIASEFAKEIGANVICISKSSASSLAHIADELLLIPEIEKEMRFGAISSRLSSQIITDILYYGYISRNMDQVTENLRISKQVTNKLKDK